MSKIAHVTHVFFRMLEARLRVVSHHSERVAFLSAMLAERLGMSEREQKEIFVAGLLHDIGKMGVSDSILFKAGRLTADEWEEMKNHPIFSYNILSSIPEMGNIGRVVLYHHERYDGHGYPEGLRGEAIPLESRILAVADSYDAMTSHRVYRSSKTVQEALEELVRYAGTQFDPRVVEAFLALQNQSLHGMAEKEMLFEIGKLEKN